MNRKFFEIDCGDAEPVVMERRDDGEIIFHDWDEETDLAAVELGFQPSVCLIVAQAVRSGRLDAALLTQIDVGDIAAVAALLAAGADVHTVEDDAIERAVQYNHLELAKLLIAAGADIHVFYESPLNTALEQSNQEMAELLISAGANREVALCHRSYARAYGQAEHLAGMYNYKVREILSDFTSPSPDYTERATSALISACRTPLSASTSPNYLELIRQLLLAGADVHAHNDLALRFAKRYGHDAIIEILESWIEDPTALRIQNLE